MDCSQPGSSVHGTVQASILEWVAMLMLKTELQENSPALLSSHAHQVKLFIIRCGAYIIVISADLEKGYIRETVSL